MTSGLKEAVIELREEDALRITEEELKGGDRPARRSSPRAVRPWT